MLLERVWLEIYMYVLCFLVLSNTLCCKTQPLEIASHELKPPPLFDITTI